MHITQSLQKHAERIKRIAELPLNNQLSDNIEKVDTELNAKADCSRCEGKGVYAAQNGPDDFDMEVCTCTYA